MAIWLRIAGIVLNALGAIILANRFKGILHTLVMVQEANDINFRILIDIFNREKQAALLVVGMNGSQTEGWYMASRGRVRLHRSWQHSCRRLLVSGGGLTAAHA